MKTNFKRLFALALTLCLLASLMVPVAFAENENVEAPSANVAETYPIRLKDLNHTDPLTATGLDVLMVHTNASNETGYKAPSLGADKLVDAYNDGTLNWKYVSAEATPTYRSDVMWQCRLGDGWTAFQIRVEDAGTYALNVATDRTYDDETEVTPWSSVNKSTGLATNAWAGDVTAYIIPAEVANAAVANAVIPEVAEGETAPTAEVVGINSLLTEQNSVGTVNLASDADSITFAKKFMNCGEYVVVLDASSGNLPLAELSLLGTADVVERANTYDLVPYDLSITDAAAAVGTVNEELITATTDDSGVTTYAWNNVGYVAGSTAGAASRYETAGWKYLTFGPAAGNNSRARFGNACQIVNKLANSFIALQINVTESAPMFLTLKSDRCTTYAAPYGNGKADWTGDVTAYLIPLSALEGTKQANITAAMTEEYLLGTRTLYAFEDSVTFNKTYVEAGEYALVYSGSNAYYGVCEASLDKVVGDELPESDKVTGTVATYDFELYHMERYAPMFLKEDGTLAMKGFGNEANSGLEGVYEAGQNMNTVFNADYKSGLLNWNRHSNTSGLVIHGSSNMGLRIQSTDGAAVWTALTVKVPVGGIYTADIVSEYASNGAYNVYLLPADADVATSLTEENKVASYAASSMNVSFAAEFDAGENLVVFEIAQHTKKSTLYVSSLTLSVLDEVVTYDFGLSNDANFIAALRTAIGDETAEPLSNKGLKSWAYTVNGANVEFAPYTTIATLFSEGKMDWALDASSGSYPDTLKDGTYVSTGTDMQNFRGGTTLRLSMETEEISYAGLRINVPSAGTYNITTTFDGGAADLYLFKAPNAYKAYGFRLNAGGENGSLRDMIANAEPFASIVDKTAVGTYTFDQAGEYVLAIVQPVAKSTSLYLSTMVMEPVEINAIADGVGYATFEDAVANATESVVMLRNEQVGNLVVPAGVTLNLNGYTLFTTSFDVAPGAQIIDAQDGKGLIRSITGEATFNEDNAQLPLYDEDAEGYRLFNVDVVSSATTGTGSKTKYWFKVNFANAEAFDLIGQFTELRIAANMSWVKNEVEGSAVATADAAFTNEWAAKNTSYIVVTTSGEASGTGSSFRFSPAVTANGVVISGDAMAKN